MSSDRDALYAFCEQSPGDLASYGALADELDALGFASIAHAFRWMCFRGVYPHKRERYASMGTQFRPGRKVPKRFRWAWYSPHWDVKSEVVEVLGVLPRGKRIRHALPYLLMIGEQKVFPSHQAAVMFLASQLTRLRETYEVSAPKKPEV